MLKRFMIPLAILGILASSSAVSAATRQSDTYRHMRHMNRAEAQAHAPQYARPAWNLPQGWPQS
jgi:hypothetical protein